MALLDFFDDVRSGASSWKSLSGSKKAKKLTTTLDNIAETLYGSGGPQSPGASPPENPIQSPPVQASGFGSNLGVPTWALFALGAGVVFLAVRK